MLRNKITLMPGLDSSSRFDVTLASVVGILITTGVVMVFSASVGVQSVLVGESYSSLETLLRIAKHIVSVVVGISVMVLVASIDINSWRRINRGLFFVGILLLAILVIPGLAEKINGSRRWFQVGSIGIQPSEIVKVLVILYLADYYTGRSVEVRSFIGGIIKPAIPISIIGVLLLLEPDFGSTAVVLFVALGMMFLSGVRLYHLSGALISAVVVLVVLVRLNPERMERLLCFQNPFENALGCGYQLSQALIAIGSGEWFGVGLGSSVQKLFYIPHANNDFLVAVIAEELGFLGICLLILLYAVLLWQIFRIARRSLVSGDLFGARICQGIGLLLAVQTMIHLGVNFGVVPTKGINIPLMSSGGSSMVATCFAIGLLFSIDRNHRDSNRLVRK
ncbi:MAG: putative lipid II flippase FtsW [Acidiferrobacteraceae bacterium]|nr:putative lipid II flippase FtsW [Acidiferrobacteraceae bacterium]